MDHQANQHTPRKEKKHHQMIPRVFNKKHKPVNTKVTTSGGAFRKVRGVLHLLDGKKGKENAMRGDTLLERDLGRNFLVTGPGWTRPGPCRAAPAGLPLPWRAGPHVSPAPWRSSRSPSSPPPRPPPSARSGTRRCRTPCPLCEMARMAGYVRAPLERGKRK
uniref:Uncharacterized protein n=1 Tax=Setaria italica TaxID=4555 RepID=K3YWA1_SETIT